MDAIDPNNRKDVSQQLMLVLALSIAVCGSSEAPSIRDTEQLRLISYTTPWSMSHRELKAEDVLGASESCNLSFSIVLPYISISSRVSRTQIAEAVHLSVFGHKSAGHPFVMRKEPFSFDRPFAFIPRQGACSLLYILCDLTKERRKQKSQELFATFMVRRRYHHKAYVERVISSSDAAIYILTTQGVQDVPEKLKI
ncbi:hypothetical protein D918_04929 [Trichuris suis]|nr:hypothetical protein D918_04929 [Trichuris suis]